MQEVGAEAEQERPALDARGRDRLAVGRPRRGGRCRAARARARSSSTRSSARESSRACGEQNTTRSANASACAGQLAVAAPVRVVGEVGGVVVRDRVELGEHDAAAEPAQQQQVARRRHLVGPVDDVGRLGVLVGLVVPHPLDAERVERVARAVAERARDGDAQPHVGPRARARPASSSASTCVPVSVGPRQRAVDRHRQLADREPGGGERAGERDPLRGRRLVAPPSRSRGSGG